MEIKNIKSNFKNYKGFCLASKDDSRMVLEWRNSEHVRQQMHNTDVILEENHIKWFSKILQSEEDLYFIYLLENTPIGLLYFNDIKNYESSWGFYLGAKNLPKGTGTQMLKKALSLAFDEIGFKKIKATVIESNTKSAYLHNKLGFTKKTNEYKITDEEYYTQNPSQPY